MDLHTFQDRLDRRGDDLDRWPPGEAEAARALLAVSPEARRLHAEAQHLRGLVAGRPGVRAPAGLVDRILAAARGGKPGEPGSGGDGA